MRGNVEQRECFSFGAIESAGSPAQADSRKLKALLILFRVVPCLRLPRELLTSRLQRASSCLPSARGVAGALGRSGGVPGFVFPDRTRLRHRLAHGFLAGLPRDREPVSDSALAAVWRTVPARGRLGMDSGHHASESAHLRSGGPARPSLPGCADQFSAAHGNGNAGSVFAGHVRTGVADGKPQEYEARRVIAQQYAFFPALNATLNGTSAALLLTGRVLIARGRIAAHRACMIAAVIASALFLGCYLFFHFEVGNIRFLG